MDEKPLTVENIRAACRLDGTEEILEGMVKRINATDKLITVGKVLVAECKKAEKFAEDDCIQSPCIDWESMEEAIRAAGG